MFDVILPSESESSSPHFEQAFLSWSKANNLQNEASLRLDGEHLDIPGVVAVARQGIRAEVDIDKGIKERVDSGVEWLRDYLAKGYQVYGVTTGFGGSADSRTVDFQGLQAALLQLTQTGVLTSADFHPHRANYDIGLHSMPVTWVRATILVRCNHLLRGHSGVRYEIIQSMLRMLDLGMTPIVPLRGSISASGDLMPLAYIAGILEGNPDIKVLWEKHQPEPKVISAQEALTIAELEPINLGPKEGLGLLNGAAVSVAVASLAIHEANQLAILAQIITGMSCEALLGNQENYHHFVASIRPHSGQIEKKDLYRTGVFQDRYALRGASQWLGPGLEDLLLSMHQLGTELNSTQDNPVIDTRCGEVYSGCNFQAASVTTATEKTRHALQMIGRMLFSVSSELINPDLNQGLPANLAADDPSLSFTMKGVDINMAAYMSELAYLANPVSSHTQTAEMNNQPINSLALISARYTMQAVDIVSLMCAAHLYVVCQALDLRVLHLTFQTAVDRIIATVTKETLERMTQEQLDLLRQKLSKSARDSWASSARKDLPLRVQLMSQSLVPPLLKTIRGYGLISITSQADPLELIDKLTERISSESMTAFNRLRAATSEEMKTEAFLGDAAKVLYRYIRMQLKVPFHTGLAEHPTLRQDRKLSHERKTIGSWISIIYAAIRDGRIITPMMEYFQGA
ncbi:uncharacterized protein ATNIH1004_003076 [Aspergillus tanneri]|uniref:Phenylalanine ammonia-lyase n=1 Tax=Aspergillus tanneri TaxID=1220188 RepID=A0A5M9MTE8_9EURO|nr:uncharacterized protein ATNIH1004_003076 [Aspergillus tanneri]KAA8650392.1 hypothetical protein ATNIH1004_003076 [Aspergillus tanneri]